MSFQSKQITGSQLITLYVYTTLESLEKDTLKVSSQQIRIPVHGPQNSQLQMYTYKLHQISTPFL